MRSLRSVGVQRDEYDLILKPVICKLVEHDGCAHGSRTIFGESFKIVLLYIATAPRQSGSQT